MGMVKKTSRTRRTKGLREYVGEDGKLTYVIDITVCGRRIRECVGQNLKVAEAVLGKRKAEIAEGRYLDKRRESQITFRDFAREYLELHGAKLKAYRSLKNRVDHLCSEFGTLRLSEITQQMIEKFQARRLEEVKPATVNRHIAAFKNIYTKAIQWGYVLENPARLVKLSKEENQRNPHLTDKQIDRLLSIASEQLRPVLITALNTGMRKSEILGLTWNDVNLQAGCIRLTKTKSGKPREIPVNTVLTETLQKIRMGRRHEIGGRLFTDSEGRPFFNLRREFEQAVRRAKIEDFRFHDLRHVFASRFVMSGGDLASLQEILGHSDPKMTQRYRHPSQRHKSMAMENLCRYRDDTKDDTSDLMGISVAGNSLRIKRAPVAQVERAEDS